jgi:hypothetical protein
MLASSGTDTRTWRGLGEPSLGGPRASLLNAEPRRLDRPRADRRHKHQVPTCTDIQSRSALTVAACCWFSPDAGGYAPKDGWGSQQRWHLSSRPERPSGQLAPNHLPTLAPPQSGPAADSPALNCTVADDESRLGHRARRANPASARTIDASPCLDRSSSSATCRRAEANRSIGVGDQARRPSTTAVVRDLWSGWLVGAGSGWFGRGVGVGVSRSTSAAGVAGLVSVRG